MFYKRKEIFRYTFGNPLESEIALVDGAQKSDCKIIDISPGGAQVFSVRQFTPKSSVMLFFTLSNEPLAVSGKVVWKKAYMDGSLYGIDFFESSELEELIIEQLKFRRREEHKNRRL